MSTTLTGGAETAAFWAVRDALHRMLHACDRGLSYPTPSIFVYEAARLGDALVAFDGYQDESLAEFMASRCFSGEVPLCDPPLDAAGFQRVIDAVVERDRADQGAFEARRSTVAP